MKTTTVLVGSVLFFILNSSCKDSTVEPRELSSVDFPNKLGNTWTYFYVDSLAQKSDTLIVSIVGQSTILSNQPATIWLFKYTGRVDTIYVTVSADTVRVIELGRSYKIIFPLQVGKKWSESYFNDTSHVAENAPITVSAGSFSNAYKIVETWGGFNDYGMITRWFVPKVGIVRIYHIGVSFGQANATYELLAYKINQ